MYVWLNNIYKYCPEIWSRINLKLSKTSLLIDYLLIIMNWNIGLFIYYFQYQESGFNTDGSELHIKLRNNFIHWLDSFHGYLRHPEFVVARFLLVSEVAFPPWLWTRIWSDEVYCGFWWPFDHQTGFNAAGTVLRFVLFCFQKFWIEKKGAWNLEGWHRRRSKWCWENPHTQSRLLFSLKIVNNLKWRQLNRRWKLY